MNTILHLIDHSGLCSMVLLAGLLIYIGQAMVQGSPTLHRVGLRAAMAAFIGYCIYGGLTFGPTIAADWLLIVVRGLLAGGLMLGISWIVMPAMGLAWRLIFEIPAAKASRLARVSAQQSVQYQAPPPTDLELAERRRAEAEQHARECQEAAEKAEDDRRRANARFHCVTLYDRHATTLADHFPRERLNEYFEQYMADTLSPDMVEERAQMLIDLLEDCARTLAPPPAKQFESLPEIAAYFDGRRREAVELPYDEETRESMLTNINMQEEQAVRRFLTP